MAKKKKKKPSTRHLKVDKRNRTLTYTVSKESAQANVYAEILLDGFIDLPKGFYKGGTGIDVPAGRFLVDSLKANVSDKFKFEISKDKETKIQRVGRGFRVRLKYSDFIEIQEGLKEIRMEKNKTLKGFVNFRLSKILPEYYESTTDHFDEINSYQEDKISKIVKNSNILETISKNDIVAVAELYQKLLTNEKLGNRPTEIKIIGEEKTRNEKVYLEKVIKQFEEDLSKNVTETHWQNFLSQFILLFNTSYVKVLEKTSVSLAGKYPDFMLIDMYNFLDIYEIKKPTTSLLIYDGSRDNYFWHNDISKAISQTENYIHQLTRNSSTFREDLKIKETDVKIIKPRGFIITGHSNQLTNEKMQNDFRLLSNSLKNIEVVLYDELLLNLKNLVKRLDNSEKK